jgi:hypothetical protein
MKRPPLLFFFLLALIALLLAPNVFPSIRLLTFSPFFALVFLRKNFLTSLWIACLSGLILDLFTVDIRFGVFALCSAATAAVTYKFKSYFYEDNFFSIPLFTALISTVFSIIQFVLLQHPVSFNLLLMPLLDAIYGFVWFTAPRMVYCRLWN